MATSLGEINKTFAGEIGFDNNPLLTIGENFTISYMAIADNIAESLESICNATSVTLPANDIPAFRTQRGGSFLVRKNARELNSGAMLWQVDCYYEKHTDVKSIEVQYGPKRQYEYSWGAESVMEVITVDPVTGEDIANSVGEPFILEAPIAIPVLTWSTIGPIRHDLIENYLDTVNSQPFLGFPTGTALMADIQDAPIERAGFLQRQYTYVIKFNLRKIESSQNGSEILIGWKSRLRNRGTKYYKSASDKTEIKFRDTFKDVTDGDLNFDGTRRNAQGGPNLPPLYKMFNKYRTTNFNDLGIILP